MEYEESHNMDLLFKYNATGVAIDMEDYVCIYVSVSI